MMNLIDFTNKVLNSKTGDLEEIINSKNDLITSNNLLRLKVLLSENTGLLQSEIDSLSIIRFFELVDYHSLLEEIGV